MREICNISREELQRVSGTLRYVACIVKDSRSPREHNIDIDFRSSITECHGKIILFFSM